MPLFAAQRLFSNLRIIARLIILDKLYYTITLLVKFKIIMLFLKLKNDCKTQSCRLLKPQDNCTIWSCLLWNEITLYDHTIVNTCTYNSFTSDMWFLYFLALLQPPYANCLPLVILKLAGGMCHAILDVIGLRSHYSTNYKYSPMMARLTTDTLG